MDRDAQVQAVARVIGIAEIALSSLIAAKPVAPKASAAASLGAVGMFLTTLRRAAASSTVSLNLTAAESLPPARR